MPLRPSNYQGQKVRVTITACDPTQRLIHGQFKDGGSTSIAVFEIGQAFRWPQVGEIWTVSKQNNYWILGSRLNNDQYEPFPVTSLTNDPGLRLDGSAIYDVNGNQLIAVAQSGILQGNSISWDNNSSSWIPYSPFITGDMKLTATSGAQNNWLPCNGASYTVTQYSGLFGAIRYLYGGSNTNFNVPNITVSGGPIWLIYAGP